MRLLIEDYQYNAADVHDVLRGLDALETVDCNVSVHYVGYFYNGELGDCVFILPKVMLKEVGGRELVFGKYEPRDVIDFQVNKTFADPAEESFVYKFAVWIYRAIVVFKNDPCNDTSIVYQKKIAMAGNGSRRQSNTFLDIILALLQFNRDNQSFFFFVLKNLHAGMNKINWTRTIATTPAIVQGDDTIYLDPVNKKRRINFDEELIVIFFSILNYVGDAFGFAKNINCNVPIIRGRQFEKYLGGYGMMRLRQIKYKYFSDKALELWQLCYAFFDESRQIFVRTDQKEYLLVKSFHVVFEAIIDALVGDNPLPDGMEKRQDDGKIVDHLYTAKSLIENPAADQKTYYIGDSKYYKMGNELGRESVYKQYTYARNVIQWNLDIFNGRNDRARSSEIKLRDEETEGYNIIPNFFISARMDEAFDYANDGIRESERQDTRRESYQFRNRLFDRDTLLLFHYDVNFLFVLSLYARNNEGERQEWKDKIRAKFRETIQGWLSEKFDFYALKAHPGIVTKDYIRANFKDVVGKVYTPFREDDAETDDAAASVAEPQILSLALENDDEAADGEVLRRENEALLTKLRKSFYVVPCKLGADPKPLIAETVRTEGVVAGGEAASKDGVLMVMMENYDDKSAKFAENGKLAVGLKYTIDSMTIFSHLQDIGYIMFHHRSDDGQHLFRIAGDCRVVSAEDVESDRYLILKKYSKLAEGTPIIYVIADLDVTELDTANLHSKNMPFTPETRYDAQYATINQLTGKI